MRNFIIATLLGIVLIGCSQKQRNMEAYVIEVTTFKYKSTVDPDQFWKRDAEIDADYTSKQPGYISRESGYSSNNEIVVVVRWKTDEDAAASMNKFMTDQSVKDYANMIDGSTMNMTRYEVK